MPRLHEQELYCSVCAHTRDIPVCCGKVMEKDDFVFFCHTCGRELSPPRCCSRTMGIRTSVVDIKKELFGRL